MRLFLVLVESVVAVAVEVVVDDAVDVVVVDVGKESAAMDATGHVATTK
jgi:hypothetical protein